MARPRLHCMQRCKNQQSSLPVKLAVRNAQFNVLERMDKISPRANSCGILFTNVNSRSPSLCVVSRPSVVYRLSVVCNVRTPYSTD